MEHQIKNAKYEGYLWQSDQSKPRIIGEGEPLSLTLTDGENPFVVEGLLWNSEENTSIQIRYVDGNYFVTTYGRTGWLCHHNSGYLPATPSSWREGTKVPAPVGRGEG